MSARRRPRRRIEIYFVLYLVALVLLLPDRKGADGEGVSSIPTDLRLDLQPERVRLECKLGRDSSGAVTLHRLDSTNTIRYVGDVSNLQFRARVEDLSTGDVLNVESGSPSPFFSLQAQPDRRAVVFTWHPNLRRLLPRTLRVTILGSGTPNIESAGGAAALPSGLRVNGSTQFVLATTLTDDASGSSITASRSRIDTVRIVQVPIGGSGADLGQFWLQMSRDSIRTVPTKSWSNRVNIGGADATRDLIGMPEVRVSNPGVVVERSIDSALRMVVIHGKTPRTGSYSVDVIARRRDGQVASTTFVVEAVPMPDVVIPEFVYPDIAYSFDPRLPELQDVEATLSVNGQRIVSTRSGTIKYRPLRRDIGTKLKLDRFVDGEAIGNSHIVEVIDFPAPQIRDVLDFGSGDQKKVIVVFYGSPERDRPKLSITGGNARDVRKLYGNLHAADDSQNPPVTWIEEFTISRKDKSKSFTFSVKATDASGKSSSVWTER